MHVKLTTSVFKNLNAHRYLQTHWSCGFIFPPTYGIFHWNINKYLFINVLINVSVYYLELIKSELNALHFSSKPFTIPNFTISDDVTTIFSISMFKNLGIILASLSFFSILQNHHTFQMWRPCPLYSIMKIWILLMDKESITYV